MKPSNQSWFWMGEPNHNLNPVLVEPWPAERNGTILFQNGTPHVLLFRVHLRSTISHFGGYASDVYGAVVGGEGGFVDGFREGGVGVAGAGEVFAARTERDGGDGFGDPFAPRVGR